MTMTMTAPNQVGPQRREPTNLNDYRRARELIMQGRPGPVLPWHVDQALTREDIRGATPRQLVNLKRLGYALVERELSATPVARATAVTTTPAPSSTMTWAEFRARSRCSCGASRCKPQVTDGSRGNGWAGVSGLSVMVLVWAIGLAGAGAVGCAIMAVGCLAQALGLRVECQSCGKPVARSRGRAESLGWRRIKALLSAAAFGGGAVLLAKLWLFAVAAGH